jgi:hypothetical protein
MVVLAREAGFAARVVIGFRGGSWNGYSNNFTVRNSDAHAWAEIWDAGRGGWLRADALAPATTAADAAVGDEAVARRLDRSWTARFDSLRVFWYRRIVSFDARSQVETLQAVKEATETTGKRVRESLERAVAELKAWLAGPWNVRRVAGFVGVIIVLVGAGWAGWNFRFWIRDFRLGKRRLGRVDPVRREAGRLLARLGEKRSDKGHAAASGEWQVASGVDAEAEAGVRAELERLRFGARETWPQPEVVLRRARRVVRAQRKAD